MNNPLVPELRADKNGKLVTRHVKTDTSTSGASNALPAPLMKDSDAPHKKNIAYLHSTIDLILGTGAYDDIPLNSVQSLKEHVSTFSPSVSQALKTLMEEKYDVGYEDLLISVAHQKVPSDDASYIFFIADQEVQAHGFDGIWNDDSDGILEHEFSARVLRGLKQFSEETGFTIPADIYGANNEIRDKVQSLTKLIKVGDSRELSAIIDDWENGALVIADCQLGHLVMDRPDDIDSIIGILAEDEADNLSGRILRSALDLRDEYEMDINRVISVMKERKTSDPEAVKQVITAEVQSLSNGVL